MSMPGSIIVGFTSSPSSGLNPEPDQNFDPTPPSNTNFPSSSDSSSDATMLSQVGWAIVIALVALAFGMFLGLAAFLENRRLVASRAARRATNGATRPKKKPPSERYLEIEKWLISKRVEAHDETCDNAISYGLFHGLSKNDDKTNRQRSLTECTSKTDVDQSHSVPSDVEEGHLNECPICFDVFQPGEIVSWSTEPKCQHIFHHHCIKEWLLKKKECPCCRETFLPIDRIQGKTKLKTINELILAQQRRSAHCFYCVTHGVVRPSRNCIGRRMKQCEIDAISLRSECVPTLDELQKIRGVTDGNSDKNEDTLHSVPSATALSSLDENSEIEMCLETGDMEPVQDSVNSANRANDMQTDSNEGHNDVPFCLEESEIFS